MSKIISNSDKFPEPKVEGFPTNVEGIVCKNTSCTSLWKSCSFELTWNFSSAWNEKLICTCCRIMFSLRFVWIKRCRWNWRKMKAGVGVFHWSTQTFRWCRVYGDESRFSSLLLWGEGRKVIGWNPARSQINNTTRKQKTRKGNKSISSKNRLFQMKHDNRQLSVWHIWEH